MEDNYEVEHNLIKNFL